MGTQGSQDHNPTSAVDRLSPERRRDLDSLCASFTMERLEISAAARELGARYLLDEITFDEFTAATRMLR